MNMLYLDRFMWLWSIEVAVWYYQCVFFRCVSVWLWPRFLWGWTHQVTVTTVCGYCPSVCLCVAPCACMCACVRRMHECVLYIHAHLCVSARFFGFYNCPCHIFRGDDKRREMSCLSERATNYCLVFLLVQESFKNTNDCIFMVLTLRTGLLFVLQKWFLWRPQSSGS